MSTTKELIAAAKAVGSCLNAEEAAARAHDSNVLVLDIRETAEHEQDAIPNVVHIPRGVLEFKISEICEDKAREILLHCGGGGRASLAAQSLASLGYENVHIVDARFEDFAAAYHNH
jgi:rhodanese-related sulfurtransferase